jgi:hypothetical protein
MGHSARSPKHAARPSADDESSDARPLYAEPPQEKRPAVFVPGALAAVVVVGVLLLLVLVL